MSRFQYNLLHETWVLNDIKFNSPQVVHIEIGRPKGFRFNAGDYIFVNIPTHFDPYKSKVYIIRLYFYLDQASQYQNAGNKLKIHLSTLFIHYILFLISFICVL